MNILAKKDFHSSYDVIVFCHLRWDFVYQRPQHLITRLSNDFKILVIEEPVGKGDGSERGFKISDNIHVLQPTIDNIEDLGSFLKDILETKVFPVGWFYSPAFVNVLNYLNFSAIVYDCMDELSLFKGASQKLIEQEKNLLSAADIVFTGGKSLYEAKKEKHSNVFCFPSSVDQEHFNLGNKSLELPSDIDSIPKPIVGYYGVIDERINLNLLQMSAQKMPDISFVMIGPICKIEEQDLPWAANIFYLGMKTYEELPVYLNEFDYAMMPFALNDATKFISPTKTLEYMCAMKPIISTKIKDVERDYSHCIQLIDDENDFFNAIHQTKADFKDAYLEILQNTSWDRTAAKMSQIINGIKELA
ncbi:amine oxidase [Pedobacter psychrophilus]|uniref:Amine oxidase n=1 Tax=Pedobacter psychrophilus TaxID=1826909 RepID=A0A179DLJ0_9SPHI|nr:glycosyltransferase [Pedobacter psychrophilus]OAQ41768.1 amine oxidase [Pedobacter psychrophilus]